MMKKKTGMSIAVIITLALPLVVSAASPSHIDDAAVRVSYADLNIENEAGARVLYARLQRASQEVCGIGSYDLVRSVTESRKARACYEEALSTAVERLDSEILNGIHSS